MVFFIALFFLIPTIFSLDLKIEKIGMDESLIMDLPKPAEFHLKITNLGPDENIHFYNLAALNITPSQPFLIKNKETKEIILRILPFADFNYKNSFAFPLYIQGKNYDEIDYRLSFRIVELKDAFAIGSSEFFPETREIEIYITNKENFNFGDISAKFSSPFFNFEKNFTLAPNERKTFKSVLNREDYNKLLAGFYTLKSEVSIAGFNEEIDGVINFRERDDIKTDEVSSGLIIRTYKIEKENFGNTFIQTDVGLKKNIVSRLFTHFNRVPDSIIRDGSSIYYTWRIELNPGEKEEIVVRTNWIFPILILVFIILVVILFKQYKRSELSLRKRISFVKAKGGEFGLKVSVLITANTNVDRINIIEKIPRLAKVYPHFTGLHPSRVDKENRRIEWDIPALEKGERRQFSYIIYSSIGVLGKFALPRAIATYEKDGKIKEATSNLAFFVSEQRKREIEDEEE